MRPVRLVLFVVLAAVLAFGMAGDGAPRDDGEEEVVLVGAGDIAGCDWNGDELTANLLDGIEGIVFTLGDHAYPGGTPEQFADCYAPSWGRHKDRTRPAVGSHDYETPEASGYFGYFGTAAGERSKGYYSYPASRHWQVIVMNSECDHVGGCGPGSPQLRWLETELAASSGRHILAYWHRPRFSSGTRGDEPAVQPFWDVLHAHGAEVVLNGDEHAYERFGRQDAAGNADPQDGIRQFVVGTGGAKLYPIGERKPNSQRFDGSTHGVLKLTLRASSYGWEFIPAQGVFRDSGTTLTRPRPG